MAAQSGKDMLAKLDQTGSGSFLTVAGLRTRSLSFNAASVDITDAESAGQWRELLAGGGIKRASLSGTGVFKDQTSDAQIGNVLSTDSIMRLPALQRNASVVQNLAKGVAIARAEAGPEYRPTLFDVIEGA